MQETEHTLVARLDERTRNIETKLDSLILEKREAHKIISDSIDQLAERINGFSENLGNLVRLQGEVNNHDKQLTSAISELSNLKEEITTLKQEKSKFVGILVGIGVVLEALRWLAGEFLGKFIK